jgi:Na+/H+ antiporter NhaD/arsenite permease-like protein
MTERDWSQPDPSGPSWMSQTDYYTGSAHALRQDDQPIYMPRRKVRRIPWQVLAGVAVVFLLGFFWQAFQGISEAFFALAMAVLFGTWAAVRRHRRRRSAAASTRA